MFDVCFYLVNGWWKLGYYMINVVFSLLLVLYGWIVLGV